jgi:hypothetical protein
MPHILQLGFLLLGLHALLVPVLAFNCRHSRR